MTKTNKKRAVVALGGNAISMRDKTDTIANQFDNTVASLAQSLRLSSTGINWLSLMEMVRRWGML